MKLQKVEIRNYRSIKSLDFVFEPKCRVLVGINESGKSNILRAISHLDPDVPVSAKDLREPGREEDGDPEGKIWFRFRLDNSECDEICKSMANWLQGLDPDNVKVARYNGADYTLRQFAQARRDVLWRVFINKEEKGASHFNLETGWSLLGNFSVPKSTSKTSITLPDGVSIAVKSLGIMRCDEASGIPQEDVLMPARASTLNDLFGRFAKEIVTKNLPPVIFWSYNEQNLLPASISKSEFVEDPDSCQPLKHMFALAGFKDASDAINTATERGRMRNLLERVSESTTKHMRQVWRDLKNIEVELAENGERVDAFVRDSENVYEFSRRSDGFKRFFTFLLMVSAKVRTNTLEGAVYLHDEPEIGLHPKGAQFLRDELIKISGSNFVVYSTHSIFMIDREQIGRHLIVKKQNEVTSVEQVDETNIVDEEVIYNALGWSVFESLKQTNLIFEGWRDHRLYKIAFAKIPSDKKAKLTALQSVGCCFAKGCKDIKNVAALLELANRECFIVSDGDDPAKQNQRDYQGWGTWFRYDELDSGSPVTAEDYIKSSALLDALKRIGISHGLGVDTSSLPDLSAIRSDKLGAVRVWFRSKGLEKPLLDSVMNDFKSAVFDELKAGQIEPAYFDMLIGLVQKIEKSRKAS